jgi:glutamate-1-semialdehyde 2,1-aminomutase
MFPDAASKSARLFARAGKTMPGGIARHPVVFPPYLIYAAQAEGCRVTDVDGSTRIDFINNFSAQIHGHSHPAIVNVIREQAGRITTSILPTESELDLAELLRDRVPAIEKIRFCNSGTEAAMLAVKIARAHTGRRKLLKMEGGYHGQYPELETSWFSFPDNWGPLSEPNRIAFGDGTPPQLTENIVVAPINRTEITRALIRKYADELAAVILDPLPSHMRFISTSAEYLGMLREETERLGIVLIFDEVFSFRVGYHGAQGHFGVTPDLVALGKIIGGGLPIGAVGGNDETMSVFTTLRANGFPKVFAGGTFSANPMSMAAGYAAMQLLMPDAYTDLHLKGERLRSGLRAVAHAAGVPAIVQGEGSLTAVAFAGQPFDSYRDMVLACGPSSREKAYAFHRAMLNAGVLVSPQAQFVGSTPMTNTDIDAAIEAAGHGFAAVAREFPQRDRAAI